MSNPTPPELKQQTKQTKQTNKQTNKQKSCQGNPFMRTTKPFGSVVQVSITDRYFLVKQPRPLHLKLICWKEKIVPINFEAVLSVV